MRGNDLGERTAALAQLGLVMGFVARGDAWPGHACGLNEEEFLQLEQAVSRAQVANGWFTAENVRFAFASWARALERGAIGTWLSSYPGLERRRASPRRIGLVLAGNIPLVGFHDVLCTWLSGHHALIKYSSQDPVLIPALVNLLDRFMPGAAGHMLRCPGTLGPVDALIATGSTNTARYFEHYFGHVPRIVRKGRVSVAVLDGTEDPRELAALGEDVFRYFGLGCRNVAKLFVPQDFELDRFFQAIYPWSPIVNHTKYGNNYDYTRALWLLDGVQFLENGFVLVKEDAAMASPVAAVHYERYADRRGVEQALASASDVVQCVVGHGFTPFGKAQEPALADYADGVDTMRFLLELR